jgi:hypothetical protein
MDTVVISEHDTRYNTQLCTLKLSLSATNYILIIYSNYSFIPLILFSIQDLHLVCSTTALADINVYTRANINMRLTYEI